MSTFIRTILHFFANWAFNSFCLFACTRWLDGMQLSPDPSVPAYLLVMELGLVLTLMNTLLRPILLMLLLPLNGLTVGLFSLAINGFFILVLDRFSDSLKVSGFWTGLAAVFIFAFLNMLLQMLIPLDDDIIYYSILGQRRAARNRKGRLKKGIVMLEIDGLSYPRLMKAVASGQMPYLKDLLNSGAFTARPYDCGVPSQTSSCQAGIMYGRNENICAFRWYDKQNRRVYSSSNPSDAAEMERMLFRGEKPSGILDNGMSINNIISGNADESILTVSRLFPKDRREVGKVNRDFYYFSLRPYLLAKSLIMTVLDAGREVLTYAIDYLRRKKPRLNRLHGFYPFVRGATNILLRDISTAMVADAISGGRESIYTTFIGYDEIAHHSGPDSHEAFNALSGIDRSIRKIHEAIRITNARSYEMVILSDHGQAFGSTFKQRYGESIGDYIKSLAAADSRSGKTLRVVSVEDQDDNSANVMAVLNVLGGEDSNNLVRQTADNLENAINENEKDAIRKAESESNDILVLASGNLVNAYFQIRDEQLKYDEITEAYPGLIDELLQHPGVGTISVHTDAGPVVLGKDGSRNLSSGEVSGTDPLVMYGEPDLRAKQLHYLMEFPNSGDLVIISPVYEDGTVAAYEELIGSHGGLGGEQTDPFLMHSSSIRTEGEIHNSREVYGILKQIQNAPVKLNKEKKTEKKITVKELFRQVLNIKKWIFVVAKTLFFSSSAYQEIAEDPSFNGPAIFIGLLTFISSWIVLNNVFSNEHNVPVNFVLLLLIYLVEILACYLTIIILRGKRNPQRLVRTVLCTGYFALLWPFVLTRRAVWVWILVILLLRITNLAFSTITAGSLRRLQSIPVFFFLVVLIPVLSIGVLLVYNFVLFTSGNIKQQFL